MYQNTLKCNGLEQHTLIISQFLGLGIWTWLNGDLCLSLSKGWNQVSPEAGSISSSLSGCWQSLTGCWTDGLNSLQAVWPQASPSSLPWGPPHQGSFSIITASKRKSLLARPESQPFVTWSRKWYPTIIVIFCELYTSHQVQPTLNGKWITQGCENPEVGIFGFHFRNPPITTA